MQHDLKTWPIYFDGLLNKSKPFEIRKNDRDFHTGDMLRLREWNPKTEEYTGRVVGAEVTYVLKANEIDAKDANVIHPDYVILGLRFIILGLAAS